MDITKESSSRYGRGTAAPSQEKNVQWNTPTVLKPGVGDEKSFAATTATKNELALLLTGAEVALRGAATSGSWIGSIEFPVTGGPANLSVVVRGNAEQSAGAHTTILIVIGAVLKSIAFDDEHSGNFTETYAATIGDEPQQTITIILLAERPSGGDDLLLGVDSLDISTI